MNLEVSYISSKTIAICFIFIFMISCKVNSDKQVDNSEIIYIVDSIKLPNCKSCIGFKLNKLMHHEVNVGDLFIMTNQILSIVSKDGDTLSQNQYFIKDSLLTFFGYDWVYEVDILKKTDNVLILIKHQNVVWQEGDDPPDSKFIIYLNKDLDR